MSSVMMFLFYSKHDVKASISKIQNVGYSERLVSTQYLTSPEGMLPVTSCYSYRNHELSAGGIDEPPGSSDPQNWIRL